MFIRIKCFEGGVRFMPVLFELSDSNSFRIPHMFIAWMASRRLILFGRRHSAVVFVSFLWDGNKLVLGFDQKRIPLPHFDCGIIQIVRYLNTFQAALIKHGAGFEFDLFGLNVFAIIYSVVKVFPLIKASLSKNTAPTFIIWFLFWFLLFFINIRKHIFSFFDILITHILLLFFILN